MEDTKMVSTYKPLSVRIQEKFVSIQEKLPGKQEFTLGTLMTIGTLLVAKGFELFNLTCDSADPVKCFPGAAIIALGGLLYIIGAKYQAS